MLLLLTLEAFCFEDENDYEYEVLFKVFSRIVKNRPQGMFHCIYIFFFSPEKLALLSLLKEVKPSPDRNMIKLETFDNLFPRVRHYDILSIKARELKAESIRSQQTVRSMNGT